MREGKGRGTVASGREEEEEREVDDHVEGNEVDGEEEGEEDGGWERRMWEREGVGWRSKPMSRAMVASL